MKPSRSDRTPATAPDDTAATAARSTGHAAPVPAAGSPAERAARSKGTAAAKGKAANGKAAVNGTAIVDTAIVAAAPTPTVRRKSAAEGKDAVHGKGAAARKGAAPGKPAGRPAAAARRKAAAPAAPRDAASAPDAAPVQRPTKLVRDRFTMPADDYALITLLKQRAATAGRVTKKNELLRAGLHALRESGSVELRKILERLPPVVRKAKPEAGTK